MELFVSTGAGSWPCYPNSYHKEHLVHVNVAAQRVYFLSEVSTIP